MQFKEQGAARALTQNRAAIAKLAASSDAKQLVQLLEQMGGVRQAAQAAAGGDASALGNMLEQLMQTEEGARLAQNLSDRAKQAGLE